MLDTIISQVQSFNGDESKIVRYLFKQSTISIGSRLQDHELPILEVELRNYLMAKTVTKWMKLVSSSQTKNQLSHIEIAKIYLKAHEDDTLYARASYHRYENGVWNILPEMFFLNEISEILEDLEAKNGGSFTHGAQKSVAAFITQKIAKNDEDLDANPDLINLKNGTYCTRTQRINPHNPKDLITTQLPFDYDPGAKAYAWENYVLSTFVFMDAFAQWDSDQDMIAMVQEAIGYSLTASMKHHISFWCVGEGSNGKGVLFHILQALGGNAATAFNLDMLNQTYNTYHLAELAGKRIVYCTEVSKHFDFSGDAMFKAITGGDKIQVRPIRERPFTMESISKVWISFNDFPHVKDTSHGFWRRVQVIPFNRQFDEKTQDRDLRTRLENELPGIFNWAMEGLTRLSKVGKFTESEQVKTTTRQYQIDSNSVESFVVEECSIDDTYSSTITPLYKAYKYWSKEVNIRPYSRKNFSRELEKLGYLSKTTNKGTEWFGLQLDENGRFVDVMHPNYITQDQLDRF